MICAVGLNLYLFTDFINFIEIQEFNGWLMCGLVAFFILINMILILGNVLNQFMNILKLLFFKINNKLADFYPMIFTRITKKNIELNKNEKLID